MIIRILRKGSEDEGFTLIEVLVAIGLFALLSTVLLSVVLNSASTLGGVKQSTDLNEQARLVLNRMSRELREAREIKSASNPAGSFHNPSVTSTVTFDIDFNGDGVIDPFAPDPETVTYTYVPSTKRILLQTASSTVPILSDNVETFKLSFESRLFQCDANRNGVVTWEEIDDAPITDCPDNLGNDDNSLNLELPSINKLTIEITVLTGNRRQEYRTQVDLRNRGG